ncbi:SAV0927 family protein [Alicyclobacillus tolerans]|uniref:DUF3055 domain-containing protein n=1 Tax=Alicyclobacillus tolerans TaxID=90970 RepID=A0A1M6Q066_9BACL|nr:MULTISPECIES: SAV0927 family protein [Alicyclobacillus]QRF23840.1 DUF3055 family protein [Alicyclobacillus sp. TC]SHK13604.1 Protein of unknown function [Alicyclobacillus montanus]
MQDDALMYEELESTETRYVGYIGEKDRLDFVITRTAHFYGKKLVACLQTRRIAILDANEAEDPELLVELFDIDTHEAYSLANFLSGRLSV